MGRPGPLAATPSAGLPPLKPSPRGGARGNRVSPPQTLPAGRGHGETRFPHAPTAVGSGWRPTGRGAVRQAHRRWGNPVSPSLNRWCERLATQPAGGMGKPGFPMSQPRLGAAGDPASRGMGKPGFPICSHQAPCAGRTTPACNCGRATPSLALPRWGREPGSSPQGGARGNPVSPPIFFQVRMKILLFLGGLRPPKPSRWGGLAAPTGRGNGETRFPHMFTSGLRMIARAAASDE